MATVKERFWEKVKKTPVCWIWTGARDQKGYGNFYLDGKQWKPHRLVWTWLFGSIPDGMFICHHCDNKSCVKPSHLFLGTPQDNVSDAIFKGVHHFAPPRDNIGTDNGNSKLTSAMVREIRMLYAEGNFTQKQIGEMFGVHPRTISSVITREGWKHVK